MRRIKIIYLHNGYSGISATTMQNYTNLQEMGADVSIVLATGNFVYRRGIDGTEVIGMSEEDKRNLPPEQVAAYENWVNEYFKEVGIPGYTTSNWTMRDLGNEVVKQIESAVAKNPNVKIYIPLPHMPGNNASVIAKYADENNKLIDYVKNNLSKSEWKKNGVGV